MDPMADSGSATSGDDGVLADEGLFAHREIFFNAARLDRSLALQAEDYRAIAQPRVARIAKR
jgi:Ala-tRNA(Pro) deacylase